MGNCSVWSVNNELHINICYPGCSGVKLSSHETGKLWSPGSDGHTHVASNTRGNTYFPLQGFFEVVFASKLKSVNQQQKTWPYFSLLSFTEQLDRENYSFQIIISFTAGFNWIYIQIVQNISIFSKINNSIQPNFMKSTVLKCKKIMNCDIPRKIRIYAAHI